MKTKSPPKPRYHSRKAWNEAHRDWFPKPSQPDTRPHSIRLLRAHNDFFTAGAVWQLRDGIWSCIQAAPILNWMRQCDPTSAKFELLKRQCAWEWLSAAAKNRPDAQSQGAIPAATAPSSPAGPP